MRSGVSQCDPACFCGAPVILNSAAGQPFLKTLAASILDGSIWNAGAPEPHDLPALTLYLPTRAAAHAMKLEFLWASPDEATFLPRLRVLGDPDPLDLFATFAPRMETTKTAVALLKKALALPPAFTALERQIHLSAFVMDAAANLHSVKTEPGERLFPELSAVSATAIARDIGALMDEAHNEGADLSRIDRLDASDSSGGEQLALQLLRAVRKSWSAHKLKANRLDAPERRNRLMAVEAEFIRESTAPVIVAGSTASVAATMTLMQTLYARPNSAIVLQGLDRTLEAQSWELLPKHPEHPQHGLGQLLARLGVERESVRDLDGPLASQGDKRRRSAFFNQVLRPAATAAANWAAFAAAERKAQGSPAPGVSLIEAETIQEEASIIALILREALESEGRTAALVTPDENLMRRVRHALTQWGLAFPAQDRREDTFAHAVVRTAASGKPEDLAALFRAATGGGAACIGRVAELIDLGVLRQMWRPASIEGIPAALARAQHAIAAGEARHIAMKRIDAAEWENARLLSERAIEALSPLTVTGDTPLRLKEWTALHRAAIAGLAELGFTQNEDDSAALFEALAKAATPNLTPGLDEYAGFFCEIAGVEPVAAAASPHPRLALWKPLDARLLSADVLVLGGLNEGAWPQISGESPWLNRRDRTFTGLSPAERKIGRSANDFVALASSAPRVYLTRARKMNGRLTRPSRWLARAMALAKGAGKLDALQPDQPWAVWAKARHRPDAVCPAPRPSPTPPLSARPRKMSVTAIETWFANPYAIFASLILGLGPLREIGAAHDARDKGILYHAALHRFFAAHPRELPPDAASKLLRCLDKAADDLGFNLENAPFWRPRFARFAEWFVALDAELRQDLIVLKSEVSGKLTLDAPGGPFVVTARADRIDLPRQGPICVFDFKTSANTAKIAVGRGAPQLSLEGLLVREGAFTGIAAGSEPLLRYIVATGGEPPGEFVRLKGPCAEAIQAAATGLSCGIARFDDPATPYSYEARAIFRDKADNDPYAHLARVKEWSQQAHEEEEGDD